MSSEQSSPKEIVLFSAMCGVGTKHFLPEVCNDIVNCKDIYVDDALPQQFAEKDWNWYDVHANVSHKRIKSGWAKALNKSIESVDENRLMLHSHLLHYDVGRQMPFLVYNYHALAGLTIRGIVSLCDDAFEILTPNRWDHQCNWIKLSDDQAIMTTKYLQSLHTVLLWRRLDLFLSINLAHILDVPFHLIAVRHDPQHIARLITSLFEQEDRRKTYYLSHNIRAIRAAKNFDDEEKLINHAAGEIQNRCRVTLFEPTTIDEYIVNPPSKDKADHSPASTPKKKYAHRWPRNYGGRDFTYRRNLDECLEHFTGMDEDSLYHGLVDFMRYIMRDVAWRDLLLVDQAKGFIMWRPFWNGSLSTGAQKELRRFTDLAISDEAALDDPDEKYPAILVHRQGDVSKWAQEVFKFNDVRARVQGDFEKAKEMIEEVVCTNSTSVSWESIVEEVAKNISIGSGPEQVLDTDAHREFNKAMREKAQQAIDFFTYDILEDIDRLKEKQFVKQFVFKDADDEEGVSRFVRKELEECICRNHAEDH